MDEIHKAKVGPKVLDHIRVKVRSGMPPKPGVTVEHHYEGFEHKPSVHHFGKGEGDKFLDHMEKHAGVKTWDDTVGNENDVAGHDDDESKASMDKED